MVPSASLVLTVAHIPVSVLPHVIQARIVRLRLMIRVMAARVPMKGAADRLVLTASVTSVFAQTAGLDLLVPYVSLYQINNAVD